MKLIFSGLTRDRERENGTIDNKKCYSIYYNKAVYRFIYHITDKQSADNMLTDFKAMKFANCSEEETDGGENTSIRFFENDGLELDSESAVEIFRGDGILETISIDYDFDWLHSVTFEDGDYQLFIEVGSYEEFVESDTGKKILNKLPK